MTEARKGSLSNFKNEKVNFATAIKLRIGKRIARQRFQIRKGAKEPECKVTTQEVNIVIGANSMEMEIEIEDEMSCMIIKLM